MKYKSFSFFLFLLIIPFLHQSVQTNQFMHKKAGIHHYLEEKTFLNKHNILLDQTEKDLYLTAVSDDVEENVT